MMMEVNKAAKNVKKHMKIPNSPIPDDQWRPMTTNDDLRLDGTRFEQPSWLVLVEGLRCLTYLQDRNIGFHGRMGRHGCVSMVSAWWGAGPRWYGHRCAIGHTINWHFFCSLTGTCWSKFSQALSSSSKCSKELRFYRFPQNLVPSLASVSLVTGRRSQDVPCLVGELPLSLQLGRDLIHFQSLSHHFS